MELIKKHPWLFLITALAVLGLATYLFNETTWLYTESSVLPKAPATYMSPAAAPIARLQPKRDTLILFLHGYGSSPHDFARAADYFSDHYNVLAPLYPGHGTSEIDFQTTRFSQWYALAKTTYLEQRPNYTRVILCGFSMGGAIALKLGEEFSQSMPPEGIITIAAPVFFNRLSHGLLHDWRLYLTRFLSWWLPIIPQNLSKADQDGADRIGYSGREFLVQIHSFKINLHPVKQNLAAIHSPILCLHARGDQTVPFENLDYIARHVASSYVATRLFDLADWNHSHHQLPLYHTTRDQVIKEIDFFLKRCEDDTLAGIPWQDMP